MEIGACVATDADLAEVTALCELGVAELRPLRGGAVWSQWEARPQPFGDSIRNTADDPASLIVVGTIDDTIVAYSAVSETTLHDGSRVGNLTDLYVMPDARGVGHRRSDDGGGHRVVPPTRLYRRRFDRPSW